MGIKTRLLGFKRRWLRLAAPLQVGERGILHRDLGWGWIPWDEIEGAYPPAAGDGEVLRLRLRLTQRLARVLTAQAPALLSGSPQPLSVEIRLDLAGAVLHPTDLLLEILRHGPEARRDAETGAPAPTRPAPCAQLDGESAPY